MARRAGAAVAVVAAGALVVACGGDDGRGTGSGAGTAQGTLTVSAAASLGHAVERIAEEFTDARPGTQVEVNLGSSSTLATQILDGAPVDVVALAGNEPMGRLVGDGLVEGDGEVLARNEMVVITQPGNPTGIGDVSDLAASGVVALCGETVPCGRLAEEVLALAGVDIPAGSVSRGQNATATLGAVTSGDAVAGIVYRTDALAAGDAVTTVPIDPAHDVTGAYTAAVVTATPQVELAEAFVDHLLGTEARAVLDGLGFRPPT